MFQLLKRRKQSYIADEEMRDLQTVYRMSESALVKVKQS